MTPAVEMRIPIPGFDVGGAATETLEFDGMGG